MHIRKSIQSALADGVDRFSLFRHGAALLVLFGHSYDLTNHESVTLQGYGLASLGVDIFFIMSGFLVTGSLLRSRSVLSFLSRRALRIFPALVVAVIFCVFVVGPLFTRLPLIDYLSSDEIWAYLFGKASIFGLLLTGGQSALPGVFTQNPFTPSVNGSLWTLPWEVLMYLCLATIGLVLSRMALAKRPRYLAVVIPVIAASSLLLHLILPFMHEGKVLSEAARFGWFFFSGSAIYCHRARIAVLDVLSIGALLVVLIIFPHFFPQISLSALLLPWLVISLAYLRPELGVEPPPWGDFSYGIYIYAFPIQQSLIALFPDATPLRVLALSLPVTVLLAWLSWNLIERRALRLKQFLP